MQRNSLTGVPYADAGGTSQHPDARVGVLGPLLVERRGEVVHIAGSHRRRLLAVLASRAGQVVTVSTIVDALWGDEPPATAARTVQSHIARLRSSLSATGDALIETAPGGYRLALDPSAVDANTFVELSVEGAQHLAVGNHHGAMAVLGRALALWRGPAYAEFAETTFAALEITRLDELRRGAIEDLAEARLESGAPVAAIAELERLVAADPGRERAWALLMRALYAAGRQHDALNAFQRARHVLANEFGLEPGVELRALERQILEQSPSLTIRAPRAVPPGLRHDGSTLLGRDRELQWLSDAWAAARRGSGSVRVMLGPPGSGRTRLAAELARIAVAAGGDILYVQAATGFERPPGDPGGTADRVIERLQGVPAVIIVDDAEWSSAESTATIVALAEAADHLPMLLLVVADTAVHGPAVQTLNRLDPTSARTLVLEPLADEVLVQLAVDDGVDLADAAAIVAVAGGMPGAARIEAAEWTERVAAERLHAATASSVGALATAGQAEQSVLDEVTRLVAARTRRRALTSALWFGRQPYRELAPYEAEHSDLFVGRERLCAELTARVLDRRRVVVVGPSGSGKSSLVRAGLVPLVRSGRLAGQSPWRAAVIVPGSDPIAALEGVPDVDEPGRQLIVVDQFEEVTGSDPGLAEEFLARLADVALDPGLDTHLVLVVRSDRYGAVTSMPGLAEIVDGPPILVGPPSDAEVRRIVEEPALRTGCSVEPELVDMVAADVVGRDVALPLLSAALAEAWRRRDDHVLRANEYSASGGLAGSVERLGRRALDGVDAEELDLIRQMMLLLADVADDGTWMRRRVRLDAVPDQLLGALDVLVDGRLAARSADSVEVVHEVVFTAWPQVAAWLDEARIDIVLEREISSAARLWAAAGRSDDDVLRGARLAAAESWTTRHSETGVDVREFLAASRRSADRERAELTAQFGRERQARRRAGRAFSIAVVLLVIAVAAGAFAFLGQRRARDERANAEQAARIAEDRRRDAELANVMASSARDEAETERNSAAASQLAAETERDRATVARLVAESERSLDRRLDLALLLAVEARHRVDSVDTRGALLTALTSRVSAQRALGRSPAAPVDVAPTTSSFRRLIATPMRVPFDVDTNEDGTRIAVVGSTNVRREIMMVVYDSVHGVEISRASQQGSSWWLDLSPDGSSVLVFGPDHVELFDATTARREVIVADGAIDPVLWAEFAPDGETFVVARADGDVQLYGADGGTEVDPPRAGAPLVRFQRDGTLAIGIDRETIAFWDPVREQVARTVQLDPPPSEPLELSFSPDTALLVGSSGLRIEGAGQVHVWELERGLRVGDAVARPGLVRGPAVFVSDRTIALGRAGQGITFYDLATERVLGDPIDVHGGDLRDLAASSGGELMVSAADDGMLAVWGTNERGLIDEPLAAGRQYSSSADGSAFAVITASGMVEVHRPEGGRAPTLVQSPVGISPVVERALLSADGTRMLASAERGTRAFVADTVSGEALWVNDPAEPFGTVALSPDGGTVYTTERDRTILVAREVETDRVLASVHAGTLPGDRVDFDGEALVSTSGQYLDIASSGAHFRFDATTLEPLGSVELFGAGSVAMGNVAAIPGTDEIVLAGTLGTVTRLDMGAFARVADGRSREASSLAGIAVSPDGSMIAARHALSAEVTLFDGATMRPIGRPVPVGGDEFVPAFTADGDLIANGLFGVSRWNLDPDQWERLACLAAGRNLTTDEWSEHVGDEPYRATCAQWPSGDRTG